MEQQLLTQADYARYRGVSRQRVAQWIQAGRIELTNGKIDAREADLSLEETISTVHERKAPPMPLDLADDPDVNPHDLLMHRLWIDFEQALDNLWKELRRGANPKLRKERKEYLLDHVRVLR